MCSSINNQINLLNSHLLAGEICVFPTDTVVGLGCLAYKENFEQVNTESVNKIFEIKNRETSKKLPWLIGDYSWVKRFAADMPFALEPFANKYWPGGTTLVVAANDSVDDLFCTNASLELNAPELHSKKKLRTLALRVPKLSWLLCLLQQIDIPIVCTSANVSGELAVANMCDVSSEILKGADFAFDWPETNDTDSNQPSGEPSKIFDCTSENFKRLR